MTAIILILIYLVGCMFAYGRLIAEEYEADENYLSDHPPHEDYRAAWLCLGSWSTFILWAVFYFTDGEKYFFKWDKEPLWKKWFEQNLKE